MEPLTQIRSNGASSLFHDEYIHPIFNLLVHV